MNSTDAFRSFSRPPFPFPPPPPPVGSISRRACVSWCQECSSFFSSFICVWIYTYISVEFSEESRGEGVDVRRNVFPIRRATSEPIRHLFFINLDNPYYTRLFSIKKVVGCKALRGRVLDRCNHGDSTNSCIDVRLYREERRGILV